MDLPEFLQRVFGVVGEDQVIGVVQRPQDGRGFITKPYNGRSRLKPNVAAYMCISTLRKPEPGQYLQRLMTNAMRTYVIVLDDIGTKVLEALFKGKLIPHYIIETSPGNFQYGYLVDLDPKQAQVLIEAFIAAGYSDPGARDVHRLVRVPGSLNFKTNPPFAARIVEANWDMDRYTFEELVEDFGLKPREPTSLRASSKPWDGDAGDDVILQWMTEQGMVLSEPNDEGWVFVECPWGHEHSDGRTDSKYQVGHGASGKWMCFHGACEGRTTKDFRLQCREMGAPDFDQKVAENAMATVGKALKDKPRGVFAVPEVAKPPKGAPAGDILMYLVLQYAPLIKREELPMCESTKKGPKAEQKAVGENLQYIIDKCGFSVLRNYMTGEIELALDDAALNDLTMPEERATLTRELMISLGHRVGISFRNTLSELVHALAGNKGYHPVIDWVRSEPWDGVDRLRPVQDLFVSDNPVWRDAVIKRWCIQAILAWTNWERDAPTSISQVPIITGPQGCGKSTTIGTLLPAKWRLLEQSLHLGNANSKDDERRITTTGFTEISEVETLFSRSEAGLTKSFLSRPVDKIRLPYDRHVTIRPRVTPMIATANDMYLLNDPTGARRYWPVRVTSCNFRHTIDMQQFWAQMLTLFEAGEPWTLTPQETTMHALIVEDHRVISNAEGRLEELTVRMTHIPKTDWTFCTPSQICHYYGLDNNYTNTRMAGAYLAKLFGDKSSNNGRKGWYVPIKKTELAQPFSPYIPPEVTT